MFFHGNTFKKALKKRYRKIYQKIIANDPKLRPKMVQKPWKIYEKTSAKDVFEFSAIFNQQVVQNGAKREPQIYPKTLPKNITKIIWRKHKIWHEHGAQTEQTQSNENLIFRTWRCDDNMLRVFVLTVKPMVSFLQFSCWLLLYIHVNALWFHLFFLYMEEKSFNKYRSRITRCYALCVFVRFGQLFLIELSNVFPRA